MKNFSNSPTPPTNVQWQPDLLGDDYEHLVFPLGPDPDGETDIYATLVRYVPSTRDASRPAIVFVHGMSDYFFHAHIAEYFADHGYAFYGLDLRKCGRSYRLGQSWHYVRDLSEYFTDLTVTMEFLAKTHDEIIIMAHSTGGLTTSLWLDHVRRHQHDLHAHMKALVLNSPWLDLMVPKWLVMGLSPVVSLIGKVRPHTVIPGASLGTYGSTIHVSRHGEWDYDLTLKPVHGHTKYVGWLRAVKNGQKKVHAGKIDAGVPTLVLSSQRSVLGRPYSAESHHVDTLLDVEQIHQWAPYIAHDVTARRIPGAVHDVFLSEETVRNQALHTCEEWLDSVLHPDVSSDQ
ncbi:MAG: alpha/beta hydrolase [Corynebacterium sp.]|nr:alpha/beta hydrolase [Corynebacterium sp.]